MRGARTETPFDAPRIRTDRLVLRAHRMTDADDWYALQSEPAVIEFLPWPERDRRHSARHLKDRTRHTRLWQANDFLALAVELDGRLIGDVSLHLRSVKPSTRSLEIGWVLHPDYAGAGYATEAADAMLDFAFDVVRAHWVTAVTHPRNIPSVGLAKRLGFVEVRRDATEEVLMLARGARAERKAAARAESRERARAGL
jgi:RimJ/RimL family protein N-acetyltransferase